MRARRGPDAIPEHVRSFDAFHRSTGGDIDQWRTTRRAFADTHADALSPLDAILGALHVRRALTGSHMLASPFADGTLLQPDGTRIPAPRRPARAAKQRT